MKDEDTVDGQETVPEPIEDIRRRFAAGCIQRWIDERSLLAEDAGMVAKIKERFLTIIGREQNARRAVADALEEDLVKTALDEKEGVLSPGEIDKNWQTGNYETALNAWKLDGKMDKLSLTLPDTVTGENITSLIYTEEDTVSGGFYWVAEEKGSDGRIITKAKIKAGQPVGGTTIPSYELTLNFTGDRYEKEGKPANPGLVNRKEFPRATIKTFTLLADNIMKRAIENEPHTSN